MALMTLNSTHSYWAQAKSNPRLRQGEPHPIVRAEGAGGLAVSIDRRDEHDITVYMASLGFDPDDREDWPVRIRAV